MIEKKMEHETAETYIENFKSLHFRSGILGSPDDKTRMLCRLLKNFERDNLFSDSTKLAYFTDKDFDQTVELIIKEDEKDRATKGIKEDSNKVNFQVNTEPNIATILRINGNYENNNIETSNPLKQNTMQNSKRNFSNNTRVASVLLLLLLLLKFFLIFCYFKAIVSVQLLSEHFKVVLELVSVSIERSSRPSIYVSE